MLGSKKSNAKKVYLSFVITGSSYLEQFKKNLKAIKEDPTYTNIIFLDPLDNEHKPHDRSEQGIRDIVEDDFKMMDEADMLLGFYTKPSVGQSMEMLYMRKFRKRQCHMLLSDENWIYYRECQWRLSAWLLYHSDSINRISNLRRILDRINKGQPIF